MLTRASILLAAVSAIAFPLSVLAEEGGGGHGGGHSSASSGPSNRVQANFEVKSDLEDTGEDAPNEGGEAGFRSVIIPTLSVPAFEGEQLKNYLFVNVRLIMREGVDPWSYREKTPMIRDAMIRAGHRRSIADPGNSMRIDSDLAREVFRDAMDGLVAVDDVERIEITNVDRHAG